MFGWLLVSLSSDYSPFSSLRIPVRIPSASDSNSRRGLLRNCSLICRFSWILQFVGFCSEGISEVFVPCNISCICAFTKVLRSYHYLHHPLSTKIEVAA